MSTYQSTAEDANIILCAIKCNVPYNFHTYKIILSITSQVFHDMFNLSQPGPLTIPPGAVVPVDNTPEDLEVLLHMIYPFWSPTTSTLDKVLCGLIMFDKYQVPHEPHNLNPLRSQLVSPEFLQSNPIWAYSLTCHWNFKEEADLAAPWTSDFDIMASVHEEDIWWMKAMELCCILILSNQWYLNSLGYIHTTPTACIACPNSTVFYTVLCYGLLLQLDIN